MNSLFYQVKRIKNYRLRKSDIIHRNFGGGNGDVVEGVSDLDDDGVENEDKDSDNNGRFLIHSLKIIKFNS